MLDTVNEDSLSQNSLISKSDQDDESEESLGLAEQIKRMKEKQAKEQPDQEMKHDDKKMYGPRVLEIFRNNDSVTIKESEFNDTALENLDKVDQLDASPVSILKNK